MDTLTATLKVREKAYELGFDRCGFAGAGPLDEEAYRLEEWLNQNLHGTMGWMENHFEKRIDPAKLVPGAKSVVSVIASYRFKKNEEFDREYSGPKIAKYARGRDYHKVFKNRLKKLFFYTRDLLGDLNGRFFVDSAPVMDKAWAQRAGNGWIGKHSNLLNKTHGSWFLIGEMILDVPFVYDRPETDHCGTCTRCIDACPTNAIHEPYRVDSRRCISYLTIELKEKMPKEYEKQIGEWMFGCDICQDVCPWNRKAEYGRIDDLRPREHTLRPPEKKWSDITQEQFDSIFEGSPVRRAGYSLFVHNAENVESNLKQKIRRSRSQHQE
jgi:epoxyqueuosine reductase